MQRSVWSYSRLGTRSLNVVNFPFTQSHNSLLTEQIQKQNREISVINDIQSTYNLLSTINHPLFSPSSGLHNVVPA